MVAAGITTDPCASTLLQSTLPSTANPCAAMASASSGGGLTWASRRHSCPVTLACSSCTLPLITEACRSKIPSRRILVPSKPGSWLFTMLIVFVEHSTKRSPFSNQQFSHVSGQATAAPIRSRLPFTTTPRSRIPAAHPGSASAAPSSRARIISALIIRSLPEVVTCASRSAETSPSRMSTQVLRGKDSSNSRSASVRSERSTPTIFDCSLAGYQEYQNLRRAVSYLKIFGRPVACRRSGRRADVVASRQSLPCWSRQTTQR